MASRRKLSLAPSTSTSLKTKMAVYGSGIAAVMALAVVAVLMVPGELTGRLSGYKWRQAMQVDSSQVAPGAILTDFVLYVDLESEALKQIKFGGQVSSPTGTDIRFTGEDGALMLPQQIESYDAKKGRLIAWVKIDTLRQSSPPILYLYYGNPSPEKSIHYESYTEGVLEIREEKPTTDKGRWFTIQNNRTAPHSFFHIEEPENIEAPVPAQMSHFRANLKGGSLVLVEWATSAEYKNRTFVVERSMDGKVYEAIGKTSGADTSDELLHYTYADHKPPKDKAFYRLMQVSKGSTYSYAAITSLLYNLNAVGVKLKSATPNPFQREFEITFSAGQACMVTLTLYDQNGNTLHQEQLQAQAGDNQYQYPYAADLPKGTYVLTLIGPDKKLQTQILTKLP